ncbi:MAG: hypothetical protein PUB10_04340 [Clostridiales bacterium]|nr:hypothetical protein [Clostridiales bacterium]
MESFESFEKINEKFDLTTEDATSWYVDASGGGALVTAELLQ